VDQYGAKGPINKADDLKLSYSMPTEVGISGGPIFTQLNGEYVVLGIHKASNYPERFQIKEDPEKKYENIGVIADQMLEEVNQWGY
jgi:V8-like Glu-specific endopeptidase